MKIRCSSLPRIAKCPGSFWRVADATAKCGAEQQNDAMGRGKDIHKELADIVTNGWLDGLRIAKDDLSRDIAVRILAGRAWATITALEMQDSTYVHVEKGLPTQGGRMCLPDGVDIEGTADLVVCNHNLNRILVLDYKSGMAAQEPAYEHPQLVGYCVLAYFSAGTLFDVDQSKPLTVFGQIIPAAGKMWAPLRVDTETGPDAIRQIIDICAEVNDPTVDVEPGPHCGWCYAAGRTCFAFTNTVSEVIVAAQQTTAAVAQPISDRDLTFAYAKVKQLAALQDQLATEIKRRITERGEPVGGFDIRLNRGTSKLTGTALLEACSKWVITAQDLGIAVNIKDIGELVAKKLGVKKIDGLSLVEQEFGQRAVTNEGTQVLTMKED